MLAGAVFANNSQVTWDTCSLIHNTAKWSEEGGIGVVRTGYNSQVTMGNYSLINHTAGRDRGTVSAHYNCQAKLTDSYLISSRARQDGGATQITDTQMTIKDSYSAIIKVKEMEELYTFISSAIQ